MNDRPKRAFYLVSIGVNLLAAVVLMLAAAVLIGLLTGALK